jgi:hypothetical protein
MKSDAPAAHRFLSRINALGREGRNYCTESAQEKLAVAQPHFSFASVAAGSGNIFEDHGFHCPFRALPSTPLAPDNVDQIS